jgi:hypothetical protein
VTVMSDLFDYDAELRLHNELFRLRATLDAHNTDGGVYFDSRAWIITARRH